MELYTNRYYKDDKIGFTFVSDKGPFADQTLCEQIKNNVHGAIVGNRSIYAWIGGVVSDRMGKIFYVFGHNVMKVQENNSDRSSSLFNFVMLPFEHLHNFENTFYLMQEVKKFEDAVKFKAEPLKIEFPPKGSFWGKYKEVADAMAGYAADPQKGLCVQATSAICMEMIGFIWSRSLFPKKMPCVAYLDNNRNGENPQKGWVFKEAYQQKFSQSPDSKMSLDREYLRFACKSLFVGRAVNEDFREKMMSPEARKAMMERIGEDNSQLTEQILCWTYALDHKRELLPSTEEKQALLSKIH